MHWTEATRASRTRVAVRIDGPNRGRLAGRLMWRGADGSGRIQTAQSLHYGYVQFRDAQPHELEGYDDWQPEVP